MVPFYSSAVLQKFSSYLTTPILLEGLRRESLYNRSSFCPRVSFKASYSSFKGALRDVASHAWTGCCFLSNAFLCVCVLLRARLAFIPITYVSYSLPVCCVLDHLTLSPFVCSSYFPWCAFHCQTGGLLERLCADNLPCSYAQQSPSQPQPSTFGAQNGGLNGMGGYSGPMSPGAANGQNGPFSQQMPQ